jgi:hypothetical protein
MIMGFVMYDVKGKGAKKCMAKRRLNVIDTNIASYCRVLNSTERMIQITEANEVAAVLAEIEEEKDFEKNKSAEKAEAKAQRKAAKKIAEIEAKRARRVAVLPAVTEAVLNIAKNGTDVLALMNVDLLKHILNYHFGQDGKGWCKYKKGDFLQLVYQLWYIDELIAIA